MIEHRALVHKLMLAVNRIDEIFALEARALGLKENTLALFYALDDGKAHSQSQVSQEWLIPKTTINTIVKECVENDLIVLEPEEHGREKMIRLTEKGSDLTRTLLTKIYEIEDRAMEETVEDCTEKFVNDLTQYSIHLQDRVLEALELTKDMQRGMKHKI